MRKINLDQLKLGQAGITPEVGSFMVQAAIVCLVENGHQSGVTLKVEGYFEEKIQLIWSDKINKQVLRTWRDSNETVEYGATALSTLLLCLLADLEIYERIPPEGEADYYLQSLESKNVIALLEVSGIWKESKYNTPKIRMRVKKKRIEEANKITNLPIYIVVTEFSIPKSKISKYE